MNAPQFTPTRERVMYDSINLHVIPRPLPKDSLIAFYLDGPRAVASIDEVTELFPGASQNPIDINGTRADYARTADVENLDMTPDMCERWIQEFNDTNPSFEHGARPVIYCNRSTISMVRWGTGKFILGKDYYLWVATGDGSIFREPGVIACQNNWYRDYDTSVVFDPHFLPN